MKRIFYLLLWALGYCQMTQAQLTLTPIVPPNPSSNVYDWYYGKQTAKLLVTNTTTNEYYAKLELKVYKDGVLMSHNDLTVTPIVTIRPSSSGSKVFEATDLLTPQCIRFDIDVTDIKGQVLQGKMPAGYYTSCYTFIDVKTGAALTANPTCKSYSVTSYQAPTLMLPMADTKINYTGINNTIFRWTNVVPAFNGILKYRFRIYEVLTGQTPWQAIKSNAPIEQRDVLSSTMHIWTSATAKIASRQTNGATELPYVWTVQALDLQNNPVGNNDGLSEARVFNVVLEKPKGNNGMGTAAGTGMVTMVTIPVEPRPTPPMGKIAVTTGCGNYRTCEMTSTIGNNTKVNAVKLTLTDWTHDTYNTKSSPLNPSVVNGKSLEYEVFDASNKSLLKFECNQKEIYIGNTFFKDKNSYYIKLYSKTYDVGYRYDFTVDLAQNANCSGGIISIKDPKSTNGATSQGSTTPVRAIYECKDASFERGTWQGWSAGYKLGGGWARDFPSNRYKIMKRSDGKDPISGLNVVNNGDHSARLGNKEGGNDEETLSFTFKATEPTFSFYYAVVFGHENGKHGWLDKKPFFSYSVSVYNPDPATSGRGGPFYEPTPIKDVSDLRENQYPFLKPTLDGKYSFSNWRKIIVPVKDYIGKEITITFTTKDCGDNKHGAYVYLDGFCE